MLLHAPEKLPMTTLLRRAMARWRQSMQRRLETCALEADNATRITTQEGVPLVLPFDPERQLIPSLLHRLRRGRFIRHCPDSLAEFAPRQNWGRTRASHGRANRAAWPDSPLARTGAKPAAAFACPKPTGKRTESTSARRRPSRRRARHTAPSRTRHPDAFQPAPTSPRARFRTQSCADRKERRLEKNGYCWRIQAHSRANCDLRVGANGTSFR